MRNQAHIDDCSQIQNQNLQIISVEMDYFASFVVGLLHSWVLLEHPPPPPTPILTEADLDCDKKKKDPRKPNFCKCIETINIFKYILRENHAKTYMALNIL
jgi:hypothetical protein